MLQIKSPAPDYSLPDQYGKIHTLSEQKGKWVLLYFYPKDDTPGCTTEACGFRDTYTQIQQRNCVIFGISKDSLESHKTFAEKYTLPFPLLADVEKQVIQTYGAWKENNFMGKPGVARMSVLIDPTGHIAKIYDAVQPETHPQEVLKDLPV